MSPCLLFSAFVCLFCSSAYGLKKGEVAYKVWKTSDDVNSFYVTDGTVVVKATTSQSLDDMTTCRMYTSTKKAQKLVNSADVTIENIGEIPITLMKQKCRLYHSLTRRASTLPDSDSFNHDLVQNKPFKGDFETGAPSGAGSHFAIYPGTKWCGYENVAENMQDLGVHNETDACCRTHDHCPYYIDRFETKYHYFNHDPWTLSHCDCDQHLFDCLKKVDTPTSNAVGNLFFGLLDVQCFKFKTGQYCSSSSILSHLWCGKKNKGVMAVMQEFPHKWGEEKSPSDILAACKDFEERQNIRRALREIKGLKLDSTDIITYSFKSKSLKHVTSDTSPRKHQLPLKPSAIDNNFIENRTNNIKDFDVNSISGSKSQGEKSVKGNNKTDENGNEKLQFRSYLYAGSLSSPKSSPRGRKDSRSPRKVHTVITRVKVLDKSDLVDRCTETDEGVIDTKAETEIPKNGNQSCNVDKVVERKEKIKRYESTPLPRKERKQKDDNVDLDISAIEFSGDLEKVKRTSVLHRPVSVNSSSLSNDNANSSSPVISSPRKPRKIVSYRTSAFSPTSKLNSVSSTISRARLQSAPPTVSKCDNLEINNSQGRTKQANVISSNTLEELKDIQGLHKDLNDTVVDRSVESKLIQVTTEQDSAEPCVPETKCAKDATEKSGDTQERIYTAKPIEIKREVVTSQENLVTRLRNKLESKRNKDFKSELQEFSYFTNKMKEKHGKKNSVEDKLIVLSPVKNEPDDQLGENEVNVISNYTNNKTMTMEENTDDLFKKKSGLSRKNRIDSDEQKHYRKYRKKKRDSDKPPENSVAKNRSVSPDVPKRHLVEMSPRKVSKSGSVRRKLPEIPVKRDNELEDDETVHQRTIRLLQERRKERREKLVIEKDTVDKLDKSKMSPADLKKTLEQKLERSDSKRKACRVRRELQLLNRENELKSASCDKSDDDTIDSSDKTDNEITAILTTKAADKSQKEIERKLVQRSKSDIVRRRRHVSETDVLINEPVGGIDGEGGERNEVKMFEMDETLTPTRKIEVIGSLMQEEAKLQEMLRKSTNFSEKRKMRAQVRQLRQKRMSLEGSTADHLPVSTLRRSASVTAGVVTYATPVYITAPESTTEKKLDEVNSPSSIEELRKKLSETQDYDEKKKIRLALRQLRQQSREGAPSGLQRSQSFIHQRSSEPIVNGTDQISETVNRSQSVTEKRDSDEVSASKQDLSGKANKLSKQVKENSIVTVTNGDIPANRKEIIKLSQGESSGKKPPVSKHVQGHSSRWKETEKCSEVVSKDLKNVQESKNSVHGLRLVNKSSLKELNTDEKNKSNYRLRHSQSEKVRRKSGDIDKADDVPNDKSDNSEKSLIRYYDKRSEKFLTQSQIPESVTNIKKPFEPVNETVTKLENQKKNRILEKCEIFEKSDRKEHNRQLKPHIKRQDNSHDKAKSKASNVLVSRADVERNKQNKLVNLRRERSNSEPQIWSVCSNTSSVKEVKQELNGKTDDSCKKRAVENNINKSIKKDFQPGTKVQNNNVDESEKYLKATHEAESRLSPSLLWLEEKRKSLPLSKDIDKLMSTMDIEAAFSEILGAVEEFPEQTEVTEVQSTDVPILEEDSCESSEMEDDLKKSASNDIKVEDIQNEQKTEVLVKNGTENNEIIDETEVKTENGIEIDENDNTAIQENSGLKTSEAKIQLSSNLSLDLTAKSDDNGAISVIHGDDGTITVQEVSQVQEGNTTITEWKKLRRTQSRTETRETDTVIEKKITSPGGSSSVYEKDVSKTKHKLTSRGSNYFTRNHYNITRKKDLDGTELVEHDLSAVTENMSVSKNESWGDKSEAKVVLNRDPADGPNLKLKSIQDVLEDSDVSEKPNNENRDSPLTEEIKTNHLAAVHTHLGRPSGCPEVKATLKEMSAYAGEATVLECTVVSSPLPTVQWFRGENSLSDREDGIKIDFDADTGKACLRIHPVSMKDAGEYKCVFENPLGTASTKGRLLVKEKTSGLPEFITELADVTICEGNSLCLECQVSHTDTVTWYKDGVILRSNADFKQTFDGTKAKLEIVEIFLDDCGTYACDVQNTNGKKKCSCKVTVEESESPDLVYPVFLRKPETAIANERDPVIIDCEVIGSPEVNVTWYHDGSKVMEDSRHRMSYDGRVAMLVVRRVTVEDGGKIECLAENSAGKLIADCHLVVKALKAAPSVTQPLSNLDIICGKKASLRCVISGEPKPDITWRKNGLIIGQMFDFKQTYNDNVAELEISKTCVRDTGSYECIATNEKGEILTSCQLTVKDENVQVEKSITPEVEQQKVTVQEETVQTAAVKSFTSKFEASLDSRQKQVAKSQASKVMLVRPGSPQHSQQENSMKPLTRTGSLKSIKTSQEVDMSKKSKASNDNADDFNVTSQSKENRNNSPLEVGDVSKGEVDVNKNYVENLNANFPESEKVQTDSENKKHSKDDDEVSKTVVKAGSNLSSLCLESSNVKEVKPVAKFRVGGEIRRSQSVRTAGSEKPEWLQVKLRKVGSKPSPLATEREKLKTQSQDSSNQETVVQNELPISVQRETKLSRSQSARLPDGNTSLALRDSTNSPSNQPNRDSVKLTPVSERAKIFQMKDSNSSSSGKSSPVNIITKAINLSRTESMRTPVGNILHGIQRSHSFKTETSVSGKGDVTLELTPPKDKQEEKSDSGSTRKSVNYWDPTVPSTIKMDYSTMTDEEHLHQLLSKSDNFDERKKLRARIKELREQHTRAWEAKQAAQKAQPYEDPIKRKHREADLMKQQKLQQFQKQAAEHHESKHLDMAEKQLRERMKLADEEKKRTLKEFSDRGATHQESLHLEISERALQEKIKQADILKKKTLDAYDQAAGKTGMSQTSTVKTEVSRDGKTVTTTRKVETVTKVGGATGRPAEDIAPQLAQKIIKAGGSVSGVLTVKTESWSSKDNVTHTSEKTESWGGRGGAMNAFKAMDAKNAPKTNPLVAYTYAKKAATTMKRNAVSIKQDVLNFVKVNTAEYSEVIEITNFSTSWNNGLAFCALIHHFYPDAFDIRSLDPKQRRKNFELAFDTAEKLADIAPLLDVEDMVRMQKPDWKCVFTYVQSFYRKLNSHERNKAMA